MCVYQESIEIVGLDIRGLGNDEQILPAVN